MSPKLLSPTTGTTVTSPKNQNNRPNRLKTAVARASAKMKMDTNLSLISPQMFTRSRSDLKKNRNLTNTDLDTVTNKMANSFTLKNHPSTTKA